MKCSIIQDLIPLYIDGCCSEESAAEVQKHLASCAACREIYERMKNPAVKTSGSISALKKLSRIEQWKASILQSGLFFIAFLLIILGVVLESGTSIGANNGFWAFSLIVPATGFMLSLINWYFMRLYSSRKYFSVSSCLIFFGVTALAYIWAVVHYHSDLSDLFKKNSAVSGIEMFVPFLSFFGMGLLLTVVFCVLTRVFSAVYARMLGKE